jgi:hypothetical protein
VQVRRIKQLEQSRGAVAELTARRAAVAEARADKDELRAALKVMKEEVDLLRLQVRGGTPRLCCVGRCRRRSLFSSHQSRPESMYPSPARIHVSAGGPVGPLDRSAH